MAYCQLAIPYGLCFVLCLRWHAYWSSQSEKTLLVSTPKHLGAQIWQMNLVWPMSSPSPPLPPFETAWWKSDSYVFPYHQWEPIWNSHLTRKWQVMSSLPNETASENDLTLCISIPSMRTHLKQSFDEKLTGDVLPPPFETARAQSDLLAVQCGQWEPIWNSQLIRKYKKIPVHI